MALFQKYYDLYMRDMVLLSTVQKLVLAGKFAQEDVDAMVGHRLELYGY